MNAHALAYELSIDDDPDAVTACYLCHGQCANFGVHGKGVRPCARGVNSILDRHRKARLVKRESQSNANDVIALNI